MASNVSWRLADVLLLALLTASGAIAQQAPRLSGTMRIYVEPFHATAGSEKLRDALIGQLKKLHAVTIVADDSTADASLSGDGDVWIKAYRSLNPRSGRLPSNGSPIYGGFLSVELTDGAGETLWSYLATANATEDVFNVLSARTAKHLGEAIKLKGRP